MCFRSGLILSFIVIAVPFFLQGQSRLSELYAYIHQTDSLLDKSEKTFYLEKYIKDDGYIYKETWHYLTNNGKIVYFQVDYILDSTEYTEIYYMKRGALVCSEEYEKVNYNYLEDKLKWGGIYYFESAVPRHVVTLGRRTNERSVVNPELLALDRFGKRLTELKRNLPVWQ